MTAYVDQLPDDYEISLRRAFVDGKADYVSIDSRRQKFQLESAAYGQRMGWLSVEECGSDVEQYTEYRYRLTPEGRRYFGLGGAALTPKPAALSPTLPQEGLVGSLWDLEMFDPQDVLLEELAGRKATQGDVALTYAIIFRQEGDAADWPRINQAIRDRWSSAGLDRVKKKAWECLEWRKGSKSV